jgi:hypothetical protein
MAAMVTGLALVEVLRPRRSKLLPRQFVLAAPGERLVAFKALGVATRTAARTRPGSGPARRPRFRALR